MKNKVLHFVVAALCVTTTIHGQYCTPAVTSTGVYFYNVYFSGTGSSGITGGTPWTNTGSQGYINNSITPSGTVNRYCDINVYYHILSCGNRGTVPYNVRVFADYNNDFDFDDAGEIIYDYDYTAPDGDCASVGAAASFHVAVNAPPTVRLRWAVREGGAKATPCGGYVGEIEDYSLTVTANAAPVINGAATSYVNSLKESQTTNDGFSILQLLQSSMPGTAMTTDANICATSGIAVTAVNGTGQWQYKNGTGAWTNVGAVSVSNALLLAANDIYTPNSRLRFVPSGAGTASFDFKAWDRSSGTIGGYANTTTSGGTTAFSTAVKSTSLTVYSSASTTSDVNVYMAALTNDENLWNVKSTSLTRTSGTFKNPDKVTSDNITGYSMDIDLDNISNKVVWAGGNDGSKLMRSNLDGTAMQTLSTGLLSYPTGVAASGSKVFVIDYGTAIYSFNADGSGMVALTSGAGQANDISITGDIEYSNNKIYYVNSPDAVNYNIVQANSNGTGSVIVYTSTNLLNGLAVTNNTLYWTEMDGSNNASVKSKPVAGGAVTNLVTEAGQYYSDVFADENNSLVYITAVDAPGMATCRIKSVPIAGGTTTRVLDMEDNVGSIAFRVTQNTLPVHFLNVKATRQGSNIKVEWNIAMEENVLKYVVERSGDGRQFSDAGSVYASNQSSYSWLDVQPLAGKNYYRIRSVDIDGSVMYSSIVVVDMGKTEPVITIYPTIVENKQFNLRLENVTAGTYILSAVNAGGQQVLSKTVVHGGGSSVETIKLPQSMAAGVYKIRIAGKEEVWVETVIVK
ncbi:MAG: GEVED domain-containing protein [Chitinophagaceae bacterium]